jgi:carbamoyl-phosphate synthase small subunit
MVNRKEARIYLEDGTVLSGEGFGSNSVKVGELVFTTAMNGYPESLTDPSYAGQVLIMTHPLVGNYGVPKKEVEKGILSNFESEKIHVEALVISELTNSEKWNSKLDLDEWLSREGVPGISGIDTRYLTKKVRSEGAMMCVVAVGAGPKDPVEYLKNRYTKINFVESVSPKKPVIHETGDKNIVVVDCGVKHGILKNLARLGYGIVRVPYNYTTDQIMSFNPAGIVYSNGPGNPHLLSPVVESMRGLLEYKMPIFGICLGHQIASLALGGSVRKMKFGHRAVNKAVVDTISKNAYITTHNHGYATLPQDMPKSGRVWLISPDDDVVEGAIYEKHNMITTQFHPEAMPGTNDANFIFNRFDRMVKENMKKGKRANGR